MTEEINFEKKNLKTIINEMDILTLRCLKKTLLRQNNTKHQTCKNVQHKGLPETLFCRYNSTYSEKNTLRNILSDGTSFKILHLNHHIKTISILIFNNIFYIITSIST